MPSGGTGICGRIASSRATAAVGLRWMSAPLRITVPDWGLSNRAKDLSRVLLPQPLLPISTETCPRGNSRSRQSMMVWR